MHQYDEPSDEAMQAKRKHAELWSKRYIHEIQTERGMLRVHFTVMTFYPGPSQYYAHVTAAHPVMTDGRADGSYDMVLQWDKEHHSFRIKSDASIPHEIWDNGAWIIEKLMDYLQDHSTICDYIESYNQAQVEMVFLREKMSYLQRTLEWAELNSDRSIEACDIVHDLYKAYNED